MIRSNRHEGHIRRIGLLWHNYPSENLGVSALSYSHLSLLDGVLDGLGVDAEYLIIGMNPIDENCFTAITARSVLYKQFSLRHILKNPSEIHSLASLFSKCDIVFDLGSGDSFSDIYGVTRFAQMVLSKYLVLMAKCPLVLSPQTIGPFDRWYGKLFSRHILNCATRLFVRDGLTFDYLRKQSHGDRLELVTDLAFALPFDRNSVSIDRALVNVGVNVSGLLFNGGYDRSNQFRLQMDYQRFVREVIDMFCRIPDVKVHLVPHVISDLYEIEDDFRVCRLLCEEFPGCQLAPRFTGPTEAKSYISNLDFFTGARMHAAIAAFSSGVPVVPFAYSRKFSGLFGSLNYEILVDGKSDTNETGLKRIRMAFDDRISLKERILAGNDIAQCRLQKYRDYLEEVLTES
jgi:colanic acid/amylovoran biosynthesis protein